MVLRRGCCPPDPAGVLLPEILIASSGKRGAPDRFVRLRLHPVPGREIGWIELQGQDGTATRLLPAPRAAAQIGQAGPARITAAGWSGMPGAALRADGPRLIVTSGLPCP